MMSGQHTPGPWVATASNEVWRDGFGSPDLSVFDRIAVVEATYTTRMGKRACSGAIHANARLIAAAPDLLEALRPLDAVAADRAVDAPEWRDKDTVSVLLSIGELRAARAAIAKATGAA